MVFYLVENYIFFTMFITVIYSSQVAGGEGGMAGRATFMPCKSGWDTRVGAQ